MGYGIEPEAWRARRTPWTVSLAVVVLALALPGAASAAPPQPQPYGHNDFGGFRNVLPPGQGQSVNALEIAGFLATGERPPHDADQREMYEDLVYAAPGMTQAKLRQYYKDATFGVRASEAESTYSPRADVTIVRDMFGVPHIYGAGRAGAMFGAGYVAAQDRMFFIDALRHAGRAQLAWFAGGGAGNRAMDRSVWADTPYRSDAELQIQFDLADELYGAEGRQIQQDVTQYVAGINKRISEIRVNPLLLPGEYPLLGHLTGPDNWTVPDVIAVASLVAGIFGKGGGGEVGSALVLEEARQRFGKRRGYRVWRDFRRANDREAPTTVRGKRFPYQRVTKKARKRKEKALPDPGTVEPQQVVVASSGASQALSAKARSRLPDIGDLLGSLRQLEGSSNALLVSARESESGRALAVFGPSPTTRRRSCSRRRSTRPAGRPGRRSTSAAPRSRGRTWSSSSATGATTRGVRPQPVTTSSTRSRSGSASRMAHGPISIQCITCSAVAASRFRCSNERTRGPPRSAT